MTIATEYQREVIKLRDRISWLEAELDLYKPKPVVRHEVSLERLLGITRSMATILRLLSEGRECSIEYLHEQACRPPSGLNTVRVHISKLRKALAPIEISHVRFGGYFLEGKHLAAVRAMVAGRKSVNEAMRLGVE